MLIAVSIKKPDLISELSDVFGRSKYFLISNTINNTLEILLNPFSLELGNAGIQSAQFLIEKNIETIITKHIGINPLRFLGCSNVKVYRFNNGTGDNALKLFNENKLDEIKVDKTIPYQLRKRKRYGGKYSNNIDLKNHNKKQDSK